MENTNDTMVIDTGDFNLFNKLVDGDFEEEYDEEQEHDILPTEEEEASEYEDESSDDNDLTGGNFKDFAEGFDSLPEDLEININGRQWKRAELSALAGMEDEAKSKYQAADKYIESLVDFERERVGKFAMAATETEYMINQLEGLISRDDIDSETFKQANKKLHAFRRRQGELEVAKQEATAHHDQVKREESARRIRETHSAMSKEMPNWGQLGQEVVKYSLESGITATQLTDNMSVSLMKALVKAKMYDDLKGKSVSKAKAAKTTASSPKSNRTTSYTKNVNPSKKADVMQRMKSGKVSTDEMFNFLED